MAARVVVRWLAGDGTGRQGGLESVDEACASGPVWVDVLEPDEESLSALARRFGLHPLAIEDCLHHPQRPKIDSYRGHAFLIWLLPDVIRDDGIASLELDLFLGKGFVITVHDHPVAAVDAVANDAEDALTRGSAWVAHGVLDRAVDSVFPLVDEIADQLERLEDEMLADARPAHLERLYDAKRQLVTLHKIVGPERDLLRSLTREDEIVDVEAYRYFQDIGDHLARVADSIDTYRDVASGAMDIYLSATSNRLNVIMKQLTIVTTVLLPLTLISGIYGMNFQHMPELHWRYGYPASLALMAAVAVVMLEFIRRRNWW